MEMENTNSPTSIQYIGKFQLDISKSIEMRDKNNTKLGEGI